MFDLSPSQKKTAALALTCVSIFVVLAFAAAAVKLFGIFLNKYILVFAPLVIAAILSVIIKPIIDFLSTRLKISRGVSCAAVFAGIVAAASAAAVLVLPKAAAEIADLCQALPDGASQLLERLRQDHPLLGEKIGAVIDSVKNAELNENAAREIAAALKKSLNSARAFAGACVAVFSAVAAFAVVPIYLFYMLVSEKSSIVSLQNHSEKILSFLSPETRNDILFLIRQFSEIIVSFFRGQILIALIMGLLLGAGFALAGVKFGFLLGFFAGVINVIPYLGTIIGLGVVLPTAYFQDGGGLILMAVAIAVFCLVQLVEAYFLTPKIMGNRTGLSPMLIIFAVFFWGTALGGIMGMLLAIPLTAFVKVLWDLLRKKYINKLFFANPQARDSGGQNPQ